MLLQSHRQKWRSRQQSETATGSEATIGVATGSNFQPPPLELAIPLIDAALSVSLQFPLRFNPKKPLRFILAIVAATVAAVIWRRPLHLIFVYCGLKLPPVPAWMRAIISYINSRLPPRLHPFRWLCKTLIKNIKLCQLRHTYMDSYLHHLLTKR